MWDRFVAKVKKCLLLKALLSLKITVSNFGNIEFGLMVACFCLLHVNLIMFTFDLFMFKLKTNLLPINALIKFLFLFQSTCKVYELFWPVQSSTYRDFICCSLINTDVLYTYSL